MPAAPIEMEPPTQLTPAAGTIQSPPPSSAQIKASGDAEAARIRAQGQVAQDLLSTKIVGAILVGLVLSLFPCAIWEQALFKEYSTAVVPVIALGVGSLIAGHRSRER